MRFLILILSFTLIMGCGSKSDQRLEVVKFDALQAIIESNNQEISVINFWATWCKPCVKELPYLVGLEQERDNVSITLVSLDFADEFDQKVIPFVEKQGISSDVILLDELDYNSWIDQVDSTWTGAIPATLVINHKTGQRKFIEKELKEGEIELVVDELSN